MTAEAIIYEVDFGEVDKEGNEVDKRSKTRATVLLAAVVAVAIACMS